MADVYTGRGYVYSIQYHSVWCVNYRHEVLTGEIEKSVKKILHDSASEHDFTISEMEASALYLEHNKSAKKGIFKTSEIL